ncbi:MAG TPA: M48 family metalloprotease [Gemmatimonadales bacterium]|nr:M48 family metalloprotease [Gemmatimonadales bacterium]
MSRRIRFAFLLALATGCATNPVTGRSELALISEGQEIQMGKEYAEQVKAAYGLYDNAGVQAYVARLGNQLAAGSERPQIPWQFHVIDDAAVNAFALPGGPVFITRGILTYMNSEAELASVLGHEIGHITARHSVSQMSQAQLANLGLGVGSIFSSTIANVSGIASAGLSVLFLKYGRDAERQSDELGFRYMVREGYDPREMASMFETLQRTGGSSGGRLPEWLSTHPNPENRETATRARIDSLSRDVSAMKTGREEFLRHVDGMMYGPNPREGFFRNGLFLHPDLRFQLQFPEGWQTQNTKQAVAAMSPQQDAILQMTLGQGSPDQAAQQFFGQQGIQSSNVSRNSINGNSAVSGYFQAQTNQGTVRGIGVWVAYGNSTYQFLGYSPAERFSAYDNVFRRAIGSFDRLTDPAALNVQAAKVELVRVPSTMTVAEFHRRYPSSIPVEQVAVINGVDAGGTLRAGQTAKRVVGGVAE